MARDPYQYFRVEARDLLEQLGKSLLEFDKGKTSAELIPLMLRLAHTLKGAARVVKQREIADHAHAIEEALSPYRENLAAVPAEGIDAIARALDAIGLQISALSMQPKGERLSNNSLPDASGAISPETPPEPPKINIDEMDVLLDGLSETSVQLAALRHGAGTLQRSRRLAQLLEEHWNAPRTDRGGGSALKVGSLIGELRGVTEAAHRELSDAVEQMDREFSQVRDTAERLRLLPASLMFVPLERAARDASQNLGKRVAFVTSGGDVRLDAQVFGIVQNALVQAVRNAVAHGIETAADREAAGKAPEGRISVEVRRRGYQAVFVCRDDGRGVDLEAVRRAAVRRGLRSTDAAKLGTEELLQLLLSGGISTSGTVTQLAGRGIGLDVVRDAAARLRGTVSIKTDEGVGAAVEIVVPISLAAVDALIVEAAGRTVAIPLEAVKRTLRVTADQLAHSSQGASITFEGRVIPFAPLERAMQRMTPTRSQARVWSAVIIEGAGALAAIGVERLRGAQNIVLRPLPDLTPSDPIVAGASLDAEGHPQLVLDPLGLVEHVCRAGPAGEAVRTARAPILVIDDSLTTRMLEQSILESAGYEVNLATSGEEGLEQARKRRFALFLVDVEMPGMDGFKFIQQVREDPMLREIPAILVTSRAAPEDRQRGQSVGAQAYIVKGEFDQAELLGNIRRLVGN
ncbi:MAG: two-component system, chemotaxis family, sensor kinase CheA [Gammaproteobacteria bacterium]|jgi:two-component system chemotaxis sensor kinase CheA|nr:two-component system, chemotaxis family, sensor kinase CheA [Gammaproteobacteria bacterium]